MMSTASAPASIAIAVSSSVSGSFAEPVPGTNGTRSLISATAARIAAARSCVDWAPGSPVEPPSEMPWLPDSSCQRISARRPYRSGAPSAVKGETTGAIDPRILAGSLRHFIVFPQRHCIALLYPGLRGGPPSRPDRVQAVDRLACSHHLGDELLLALLLAGIEGDLIGDVTRDDHDAVAVAGQDVTRLDGDARTRDGGIGLPGHMPPPEHRRVRRAVVDGDVEVAGQCLGVPDRAVGDDAHRPPDLGAQREDIADRPGGRVTARL